MQMMRSTQWVLTHGGQRRSLALRCLAIVFVAVAGMSECMGRGGQDGAAHGPSTWSWDLRARGCAEDDHEVFAGGLVPDARVAFGSDEEIVVLCHNQRDRSARPYEVTVRALAIGTFSGQLGRTLEWTGYGSSAVFPTFQGNYAVLKSGTVLYSPGLREELAHSPHGVVDASPGGGRLVISTRPVEAEEWMTLDAGTLTENGALHSYDRGSISDRSVASLWLGLPGSPFVRIAREGREPVDYVTGVPAGSPRFVSEEALVIVFPDRFDLISTAGERLLSEPRGDNEDIRVTASRDGRRMAVVRQRHSGHWSVIKFEQVTVYDLSSRVPIWTFKHKGMKGADHGHSDVALSPDGSLLAIKWPGTVRLFKMPPAR